MIEAGNRICVEVLPPEPLDLVPEPIDIPILFEDENVLAINKPAGMVVHPSAGHSKGTLVHAALAYTPFLAGIGGKMRPGIVHRLDKNTSGIILIAKNEASHKWLQQQFKDRLVVKKYLALVDGQPDYSYRPDHCASLCATVTTANAWLLHRKVKGAMQRRNIAPCGIINRILTWKCIH